MISETKSIKMRDGVYLNSEIVEKGQSKWLIVTHGLGEHQKRHHYLYELFSQEYNICFYDLRGHGQSKGKRAYVNSFKDYVLDLGEVIDYLGENYSMKNFVLHGHSMGALVVSSFMQNEVREDFYPSKVYLSSPPVAGSGTLGGFFHHVAPMKLLYALKSLPITLPVEGLLDLSKLSHDPRVYEAYVTDPLNCMKIHTKLFFEILTEAREVFAKPLRVNCDLFCSIGSIDGIIDPKPAIKFFSEIEKNCQLKVIEGAYHEVHNEIEKFRLPMFEFLKESLTD